MLLPETVESHAKKWAVRLDTTSFQEQTKSFLGKQTEINVQDALSERFVIADKKHKVASRFDLSGHIPDIAVAYPEGTAHTTNINGVNVGMFLEVKGQESKGSVQQKYAQSIADLGKLTADLDVPTCIVFNLSDEVCTPGLWKHLQAECEENNVGILTLGQLQENPDVLNTVRSHIVETMSAQLSKDVLERMLEIAGPSLVGQLKRAGRNQKISKHNKKEAL